jgi:syntaxin 1B/2/3
MNRLSELKSKQKNTDELIEVVVDNQETSIHQKYLDEMDKIVSTVKQNIKKVRSLADKYSKTSTHSEITQIRNIYDGIINDMRIQIASAKDINSVLEKDKNIGKEIKKGISMNFNVKMQKLGKEFENMCDVYKKQINEREIRQLKLAGVPEEKISDIINSGPDQVQKVMQETINSESLEELVEDLEARRDDIMALERNVIELSELFKDLANLVDLQQDTIDNIEHHIKNAVHDTNKGVEALGEAEGYQKKAKKRQCCILMIVLLVLVVIMGSIFGPLLLNS